MENAELYARMEKMTGALSGPLRKHFSIVLGTMLYIAYIALALVFFRPSFFACIGRGGTLTVFLISVANATFFLMFGLYLFKGTFSEEGQVSLTNVVVPGLYLAVVFLFMSYGMLFYLCKDPIHCKDCDLEDQTQFNSLILGQVDGMTIIKTLRDYYKEQMIDRRDITTCANYYDSSYRDAKPSACTKQNAVPACNICPDPRVGAPILAEFFVMTSCRTCVVDHQYDSYVSDKMIDVALAGGARCLDFDVYARTFEREPMPIVTVGRDRDNHNLQRNYVPLELCFRRILYLYFAHASNMPLDPLFIHLKLHHSVNKGCAETIARLLQYHFSSAGGKYLLQSSFNYRHRNLGEVPICQLFNKLIVMVHTCAPKRLAPMLDEMTNIMTAPNGSAYAKEKEWLDVNASNNKRTEFIEFNRRHLTFVRTSFHPYTPISNEIACHTVTRDRAGRFQGGLNSDSMMDLIGQKQTINNDPSIPMTNGCQFVAMNFQNLDQDMKKYISYFKRASFIIKPKHLRRKELELTDPIPRPLQGGDYCMHKTRELDNAETCLQSCLDTNSSRRLFLDADDALAAGDCTAQGFVEKDPSQSHTERIHNQAVIFKKYVRPS